MDDINKASINIAMAIESVGISPNVSDSNMEPANLVDAIYLIARALNRIADLKEIELKNTVLKIDYNI